MNKSYFRHFSFSLYWKRTEQWPQSHSTPTDLEKRLWEGISAQVFFASDDHFQTFIKSQLFRNSLNIWNNMLRLMVLSLTFVLPCSTETCAPFGKRDQRQRPPVHGSPHQRLRLPRRRWVLRRPSRFPTTHTDVWLSHIYSLQAGFTSPKAPRCSSCSPTPWRRRRKTRPAGRMCSWLCRNSASGSSRNKPVKWHSTCLRVCWTEQPVAHAAAAVVVYRKGKQQNLKQLPAIPKKCSHTCLRWF